MTTQFLFDRLAKEHMATLHAEAAQTRLIRSLDQRRQRRFRFWRPRAARGAPAALTLIENTVHIAGEVDTAPQSRVA